MIDLISVIGFGITAAVLASVLRQYKPEFGIYVSLAAGIIIFGLVLAAITPAIDEITGLSNRVGGTALSFAPILFKSLAVCYITSLASDACKDSGEKAVATKIDLAGRAAVVVISLPLWRELTSMLVSLLSE